MFQNDPCVLSDVRGVYARLHTRCEEREAEATQGHAVQRRAGEIETTVGTKSPSQRAPILARAAHPLQRLIRPHGVSIYALLLDAILHHGPCPPTLYALAQRVAQKHRQAHRSQHIDADKQPYNHPITT